MPVFTYHPIRRQCEKGFRVSPPDNRSGHPPGAVYHVDGAPVGVVLETDRSPAPAPVPVSAPVVEDGVEFVDLYPGDIFYFPNGMWHKVETLPYDGPGLTTKTKNKNTILFQKIENNLIFSL